MRKMIVGMLALTLLGCSSQVLTAQVTYTTTADACSGKANQACFNIPTVDTNGVVGVISIDNRAPSRIGYLDLGPYGVNEYHGAYAGFVANPDGTLNDFNGVASFVSDSGTVEGSFAFHAYYVRTCSGRACGGTLGWHYKILSGSTVTVQ